MLWILNNCWDIAWLGADCACHMSEETYDASRIVPWNIITTMLVNGILGFGMLIAAIFCTGDVESVLKTQTGYPFIQVFYNATNSLSGTTLMVCIPLILSYCAIVGQFATASRQMWSFARDRGLPFWEYLSIVCDEPCQGHLESYRLSRSREALCYHYGQLLLPVAYHSWLRLSTLDQPRPWSTSSLSLPAAGLLQPSYLWLCFFGGVFWVISNRACRMRMHSTQLTPITWYGVNGESLSRTEQSLMPLDCVGSWWCLSFHFSRWTFLSHHRAWTIVAWWQDSGFCSVWYIISHGVERYILDRLYQVKSLIWNSSCLLWTGLQWSSDRDQECLKR